MKAAHTKRTPMAQGPFWRPDARERLRAFLPEFMLSVVATTCTLVVMEFLGDVNLFEAVILYAICQIVVQGALYVLTYLSEKPEIANMVMLFAISGTPMLSAVALPFGIEGVSAEHVGFGLATSAMMGMMVFYLTRTRVTFYLLLLEVLVISDAIRADSSMLIPHLVGLSAYIALYIVRRSPARMSIGFDARSQVVTHKDNANGKLPLSWQTVLLATAVGMLSLTLSLGTGWCVNWWRGRANATGTIGQTVETEPRDDTQASEIEHEKSPSEDTVVESPSEVREEYVGSTTQAGSTGTHSQSPLGPLLALVVILALPGLPFAMRLLMRRWTRLSILSETRSADRAARVYLAILSRLKALGIERDKGETPREFLILYEDELAAATASAEIGADEWAMVTDVYEKARYAELDVTEAELDACWRVYDALPGCACRSYGWLRYLAGPFWLM